MYNNKMYMYQEICKPSEIQVQLKVLLLFNLLFVLFNENIKYISSDTVTTVSFGSNNNIRSLYSRCNLFSQPNSTINTSSSLKLLFSILFTLILLHTTQSFSTPLIYVNTTTYYTKLLYPSYLR